MEDQRPFPFVCLVSFVVRLFLAGNRRAIIVSQPSARIPITEENHTNLGKK